MQVTTSLALVNGAHSRVKHTRHGFMLYNTHDAYVGRSLELYGEFSYGEIELFSQLLKPGMTILDVGANIGAHTLYFAEVAGPTGTVVAFEPQRAVHQILVANLALNDVSNCRAMQMGVGKEPGQAFIPAVDYAAAGNFGGVSLDAEQGEAVVVVPIDGIGLERCDFIKIDVEGMEEAVIDGAAGVIRRDRPALYVENDRRDKSESLIRRLQDLNYRMFWHLPPLFNAANIYGNAVNVFPGIVSINMLCLPAESVNAVTGLQEVASPFDWPLAQ
ncbi:MAG TPA: FkbM family methyltransferase [Pseudolabrys sp.]|jgi:FkbM family methyltransferase